MAIIQLTRRDGSALLLNVSSVETISRDEHHTAQSSIRLKSGRAETVKESLDEIAHRLAPAKLGDPLEDGALYVLVPDPNHPGAVQPVLAGWRPTGRIVPDPGHQGAAPPPPKNKPEQA